MPKSLIQNSPESTSPLLIKPATRNPSQGSDLAWRHGGLQGSGRFIAKLIDRFEWEFKQRKAKDIGNQLWQASAISKLRRELKLLVALEQESYERELARIRALKGKPE